MIGGYGASDPAKFAPIEPHLCAADDLVEVESRVNRADSQSVGLGHIVDLVCRDQRSGAGHVLDNDVGVTRDVLGQVLCEESGIKVVDVSRLGADDNAHGLPLIERALGAEIGAGHEG